MGSGPQRKWSGERKGRFGNDTIKDNVAHTSEEFGGAIMDLPVRYDANAQLVGQSLRTGLDYTSKTVNIFFFFN